MHNLLLAAQLQPPQVPAHHNTSRLRLEKAYRLSAGGVANHNHTCTGKASRAYTMLRNFMQPWQVLSTIQTHCKYA